MIKRKTSQALAIIIILLATGCNSKKMVSMMIGRQLKLNVPPEYIHDNEGIVVVTVGTGTPLPGERAQTGTAIFQQDGITITAFDVDHEPIEPAVGYVIEYKDKKVVLSGDTKKNALLQEMAQNCDLLIHDVMLMSIQQMIVKELSEAEMNRNAKIITDIQDYHTSPGEAIELAQNANVKRLVLNHLAPAPDNRILKKLYKKELKGFEGPIHLASDGDAFIVK